MQTISNMGLNGEKELQEIEDYLISLDGMITVDTFLPPRRMVNTLDKAIQDSIPVEKIIYDGENLK